MTTSLYFSLAYFQGKLTSDGVARQVQVVAQAEHALEIVVGKFLIE